LSESVNFIKTNQSDQHDLSHQSDSEYHNDYTSESSVNTDITKEVSRVTRTFISVSMIINLSQEQIQIINNAVQTAVTAVLKKYNSQTESSDSSKLSEPEK